MYKRALTVLLTAHLLFLAGFLCLGQMEEIQRNLQIKVPVAADSESRMIGIASRTSSGHRGKLRDPILLLEHDLRHTVRKFIGIQTVQYDICHQKFPLLILTSCFRFHNFQQNLQLRHVQMIPAVPLQFIAVDYPLSDGSYDRVQISEETVRAVGRALDGEDISEGALYFAARDYADSKRMRWFDEKLTLLFRHGGHEFFKE